MNEKRVQKVLENMGRKGLGQAVFCDPVSILYLTGRLIEPGERLLALYLNRDGGHKFLINDLFTVPEDLGVEKVRFFDTDDAVSLLAGCVEPGEPLGVDKNLPARFLLPLMAKKAGSAFVQASDCVDGVRACKDADEREKMRRASHINDTAMAAFLKLLRPGMTEQQLGEAVTGVYRGLGADGCSFEPLVEFGANAAVGHHAPDGTRLAEGDAVLLDVGCKKDGYCADMTRTFYYRSVSPLQQKLHGIVLRANEAAEAMIRPGVKFCEIDAAARSLIEKEGYGGQFTHRLGHSIGMEVHEPGDVSSANGSEVRPGMTFSVEPGIYLEGETGVRIEDLVLVTETGCEVLNRYPKELRVLE